MEEKRVDRNALIDALNVLDAALARAIGVAQNFPRFQKSFSEDQVKLARLELYDDGTVELSWPRAIGGYDDFTEIEIESVVFPQQLLFCSAERLLEFSKVELVEQRKRHDAEMAAWREREKEQRRATFEMLKMEFDE